MIKKMLSSKKGASSIMVMLMLVVLVVFGIAALTTALSNMRLGQKVVDWNEKYYGAEGTANERYAIIDGAVRRAFDGGADSIADEIDRLEFDASLEPADNTLTISYETWNGDIGISTVLCLDLGDPHSLRPVQWVEIQK
jgi:hypothetical protein